MYALLAAAVASVVAALVLTPICRDLAIRWGVLDRPDSKRKTHTKPVPRVGGIPIFIAYLGTFGLLMLLRFQAGIMIRNNLDLIWRIFPAAALIFAIGLIDDIYDLRPWQKLLGQVAAATMAFLSGLRLTDISGFHFGIWLTLPVTVIWLIGCTNAFNLIDGVDGLAAGVGFFATITTVIEALLRSNVPLALATLPLAGALLGFLRYNSNPATIYLGDSGSLLIGFLLGSYSIVWSGKSATALGMTAPLMVLALPLLDTVLAITRRYLRHKPVFGPDRGHIHHKLLARGFTPRRVVYVMYAISGIGACFSLLQSAFHDRYGGLIILLFCGGVCLVVRYLGYTEFEAARRIVFGGAVRKLLNAELELIALRDSLISALTADECWSILRVAYSDFGFSEVRLKLTNRIYSASSSNSLNPKAFTIRIELSETEYLNLSSNSGKEVLANSAAFADAIGTVLRAKVSQLRRTPAIAHAHELPVAHATHAQAQAASVKVAG
ncbi:MAG TPA: MraY family glycosyltransferase [Bryobacteraceae bacterium]|jgi:UDP-GlcNAc:undecaprenyl-phosphate GlcNAc-1-phosphate transferase|nr:MraY family glycosyltransferase [Bryobacteraceae bacterium]